MNTLLSAAQASQEQTWKISNPAISRIPMKEAPCLCLRSRALLILCTSHLNRRSYVAFASASTAKSACRRNGHTAGTLLCTNTHTYTFNDASKHTCSLVWAFCTYSRPTLILGVRMARVNSSTLMPSRWHSFWAAVLSGMEAWSWCFSFMKEMFPNWSTAEITLSMAEETEREMFISCTHGRAHSSTIHSFTYVLFRCEAHYSHGVHGLGEVLGITLTRNRDGPTSEKAILINTS